MRNARWLVLAVILVAAASTCGSALGVGPWPGLAQTVSSASGDLRYTATRAGGATTVKAIASGRAVASARFDGAWGIPAVTSVGLAGGLSPDGRMLVLVEPPSYQGLRTESRFLVVSTPKLEQRASITLRGEFGFDAISPDRSTLYVIQHVSSHDLVRYVVRAYDLRARRLLPGAIVDEREPSAVMRGYPIARATSPNGAWVYTLYMRNVPAGRPFVHALNAAGRSAFCVDLPAWRAGNIWEARLGLAAGAGKLRVLAPGGVTFATIDTKTLAVERSP
jgi:hypothetical protein